MQQVFNRYIQHLKAERNVSSYTIRNYINDIVGSKNIKGFFTFLKEKGLLHPGEAGRTVIREYLTYLTEEGICKASVARKMSALRSFYRYMARENIIPVSPMEHSPSPKLDRRLPQFLSIEEIRTMLSMPDLSTPHGQRNRAILELLYASGLRVSELAAMDIDHLNMETREIRVRGKGDKERIVLMGIPALRALTVYLNDGRPALLNGKPHRAVFISKGRTRIIERRIQKEIEKIAAAAGIDRKVHPHMLRHTFATHMLDGGADLRVVQELLGHSNLSTTQVYTHVTKTQAKKVYLRSHPLAQKEAHNDDE